MTKKTGFGLLALIGAFSTLGPFTVDPYLASFPQIAVDLNSDIAGVQLSLSAFTLGFTIGFLLAGPISDAYGRRKPLIYGGIGYVVATVLLALSTNIFLFQLAKVGQGIAGAWIYVVGLAMVRDLYEGKKLFTAMGQLFLVAAASWVLAPSSGSFAILFTDWRGLALAIAVYGAILVLVAIKVLPETLHFEGKQKVDLASMLKGFKKVLSDRNYTGLVIVQMVLSIAQFGYLAVLPLVYTESFAVPAEQIGYWLALNSIGAYVGIQISTWLAKRFAPQWVLTAGLTMSLIVGSALVYAGVNHAPFAVVEAITFAWLFCFGFQFTLLQTLAMANHGEEAGTASALLSAGGYVATTVAGPYFTAIDRSTSLGYGSNILMAMGLGFMIYLIVVRPWAVKESSH